MLDEKIHASATWRCDLKSLERLRGACWQIAKTTEDKDLASYMYGAGDCLDFLIDSEYSSTIAGIRTSLAALCESRRNDEQS